MAERAREAGPPQSETNKLCVTNMASDKAPPHTMACEWWGPAATLAHFTCFTPSTMVGVGCVTVLRPIPGRCQPRTQVRHRAAART